MRTINKKILLKVLEILETQAAGVIDIAWAMSTGKPESYRRLQKLRDQPDFSVGKAFLNDIKLRRREYCKFRYYVGLLEEQGLVKRSGTHRSLFWKIGVKGVARLQHLRKEEELMETLVLPGGLTIVSYDIPEKLRRGRDEIRDLLKLLGFSQVHKSLWSAQVTVEKNFLEYLRGKHLLEYVHIFEVSKRGTLEKVTV